MTKRLNGYVSHDMTAQWIYEKHSTSLVTMEMQIKSTMRYHFIFITTAKSQKLKSPTAGKDVEELDLSQIVSKNVKSTTL